jgi:hypothetical protein
MLLTGQWKTTDVMIEVIAFRVKLRLKMPAIASRAEHPKRL